MYFFSLMKTMLLFFCILTTVMTIRLTFAFFNALFIEFRIFIVFKVKFSLLRLTINLFLQYNISYDFDKSFLIIRFYSSVFAFMLVSWAAFCAYVSFCIDFCEFCMSCNVCEICVFKICKFSIICFALLFFLMFSAFCRINCRIIFCLLFILLWS